MGKQNPSKSGAADDLTQAKAAKSKETIPLQQRFRALRAKHPLPPATGELADKDFFDQLSGEIE